MPPYHHVNHGVVILISLLLLICGVGSTPLMARATYEAIQDIKTFVEEVRRCRNIPGLGLTVVDRDGPIIRESFGLIDIATGEVATKDTLFPIGSTTKAFTSTLLAILIDEHVGNITWDTTVRSVMGDDFELYNSILTHQTTLRDLLSHATGLPDNVIPLMAVLPDSQTRSEIVRSLKYHKPIHLFRRTFEYNNYMYVLAGHIAEKLTGSSWEDLVQQRLFNPLGMTVATFIGRVADLSNVPISYTIIDGQPLAIDKELNRFTSIIGPAISILASPVDMAKWLQFHVNGGVAPSGDALLGADILRTTYEDHTTNVKLVKDFDLSEAMFPVSDITVAYGLGWVTGYYRGYKRIWHPGYVSGHEASVWILPNSGVGIFLATTGMPQFDFGRGTQLISQYIVDKMLGLEPWLNATTACSFPEPWQAASHPPTQPPLASDDLPAPLQAYIGTYSHPGFGQIQITRLDNTNDLHLHMDQYLNMHLHYNQLYKTFFGKFLDKYWYIKGSIPMAFERSEGGVSEFDVLLLPLAMPFDTPVCFRRDMASIKSDPNNCICGVISQYLPSISQCVCLITFMCILRYIK